MIRNNKTLPPLLRLCLLLAVVLLSLRSAQSGLDFGVLKAVPAMVTGIYLEDKDSVPIMFGDSATLTARTYPEGQQVEWAITPDDGSEARISFVAQGNNQVVILPTDQSGSGWIRVEASISGGEPVTAKVYVGCQICTGDSCNVVGSGTVNIGSIDISINLGQAEEGMPAGDMFVRADKPSPELFTPGINTFFHPQRERHPRLSGRYPPASDHPRSVYRHRALHRLLL